jgi:hypothetical protein
MSACVDLTLAVADEKAKTGESFDIFETYQRLTLDVIGRCALALDLDCQTSEKVSSH